MLTSISEKYVPPHLRANYKHPAQIQVNKKDNLDISNRLFSEKKFSDFIDNDDVEIQKRLSGIIKNFNKINKITDFCDNPTIDDKKVLLNDIHYVLVYKTVLKILSDNGKKRHPNANKHSDELKEISHTMMRDLESCTIGAASQIVKIIGKIKYKDIQAEEWLLNKILTGLDNAKDKELFMILQGSLKFFSLENLKKLIIAILNIQHLNLENMQPNLLSTLLAAVEVINKNEKLDKFILDKKDRIITIIGNKISEFSNGDMLFLCWKSEVIKRLGKIIEEELFKRNLSKAEKIEFFRCFSNGNFKTSLLSNEDLFNLLNGNEIDTWNKIFLFFSVSSLGLIEFKEEFSKMLTDFHQVEWKKVYLSDLVKLLGTAAVYFDSETCPPVIKEIVNYLQVMLFVKPTLLEDEDLTSLQAFSYALGLDAEKFPQPTSERPPHKSLFKKIMIESLESIISQDEELKVLTVQSKCFTHQTRTADVAIAGFEKLGIDQKPIAIEFDGKNHFRVDGAVDILGKDIIRYKIHKRAGFEVWGFRGKDFEQIQKIVSMIVEKLKALLEKK